MLTFSSIIQAHKCLSTDVHSLQIAAAKESATIATLRQAEAEMHSNLTTVQSQLQQEQALRVEDRSSIRQELTSLKEIADHQIRHACPFCDHQHCLGATVYILQHYNSRRAPSEQARLAVSQRMYVIVLWTPVHTLQQRLAIIKAHVFKVVPPMSAASYCGFITLACRSAKEDAISRIEEKSRALQSMHEQVTADLARVDQQNKRELQISDQMLASMQVLHNNLGHRAL